MRAALGSPREPLALALLRKLAEAGGEVETIVTPVGRLRMSVRGARSLPNLLVLHGLGDSIAGWAQASIPLLRRFRVHLVDLCGHGLSDAPPDWRFSSLLAGARAAVAHVPNALVVGHSLGGWLSLKLLLEGSLKPPGLILVNPAGATLDREAWAPFQKLILATDADGARNYLRRAFHKPPRALELFPGEVLRQMRAPGMSGFLSAVIESDFIAAGALRALGSQVPMRIIWGTSDRLLPEGTLPFWRSELPRAELVLIDGAGHVPHLERPLALARAIAKKL